MKFEIHITTKDPILPSSGVPYICVDNLTSDGSIASTHWMTSLKVEEETIDDAIVALWKASNKLTDLGYSIVREKLECLYEGGVPLYSTLYVETHTDLEEAPKEPYEGVSKNCVTGQYMKTYREYTPSKFLNFIQQFSSNKVEVCLYDSNVTLDSEFLPLPKLDSTHG